MISFQSMLYQYIVCYMILFAGAAGAAAATGAAAAAAGAARDAFALSGAFFVWRFLCLYCSLLLSLCVYCLYCVCGNCCAYILANCWCLLFVFLFALLFGVGWAWPGPAAVNPGGEKLDKAKYCIV